MPWTNGADGPIPVPATTATDPETGAVIVTAWDDRFHLNLPAFGYDGPTGPVDAFFAAHPALEPYRVNPSPLSRVYAGEVDPPAPPVLTAAVRFADEAEARAVAAAWWADEPA